MRLTVIIILYNPDVDFLINNVKTVYSLVDSIVLVDNSDKVYAEIKSLEDEKVTYSPCLENFGIARAQNIGLQIAKEQGSEYVVLFDQDSVLANYDFSGMLELYERYNGNLACIGPRIIDSFSNKKVKPFVQREVQSAGEITFCSQIIASGKMIRMSVLDSVGLFEEELFIDGVDHEWCWRATKKGYQIAINEKVKMVHTLGDERYKFLGVTFKVAAPIRTYYQFRNILLLSRRKYVPFYWKMRNILSIPIRFFVFSFMHESKCKYRKFMILGIKDGFLNQIGKCKK